MIYRIRPMSEDELKQYLLERKADYGAFFLCMFAGFFCLFLFMMIYAQTGSVWHLVMSVAAPSALCSFAALGTAH